MKCSFYKENHRGLTDPVCSGDTAQSICYLVNRRYLDFNFLGVVPINDETMKHMGVNIGNESLVGVYGKRNSTTTVSDHTELEEEQIKNKKHSVVVFLGVDNSSMVRRITPNEYDHLILTEYVSNKSDLFLNT